MAISALMGSSRTKSGITKMKTWKPELQQLEGYICQRDHVLSYVVRTAISSSALHNYLEETYGQSLMGGFGSHRWPDTHVRPIESCLAHMEISLAESSNPAFAFTFLYIYIYIYIYMCVYIYVYIHTHSYVYVPT